MVVPTPRIRLGVAVPHALMKFDETKNYSIANQQISKKDWNQKADNVRAFCVPSQSLDAHPKTDL
jgi:hypothetical protein